MKLLIVEDEHRIAQNLKKGFAQESITSDLAFDGLEGFDLASTEKYDVIILDRLLPGMDGLSICKKLREENNHTPILLLTALSETENKIDGLNSGADDYLAKPFSFNELLARVKALSRRPQKIQENLIKVKDLSIDTETFEVKRNGKKIILSKKEYLLLEYLMRNKNKTISKDQIIQNVWNYDSDILPNTIEVYIGYLRNKIDSGHKEKLIITRRGFGYSIKE